MPTCSLIRIGLGVTPWLEVYGWASWMLRKGILTPRNPSNQPQSIDLDIRKAFELPARAAQDYVAKSPWKEDAGKSPVEIRAHVPHSFHLAPFQVLTLEFAPRRG